MNPDEASTLLKNSSAGDEIWFSLQTTQPFRVMAQSASKRWRVDVSKGPLSCLLSHALARWVLDHPGYDVCIHTRADDPLVYTMRRALAAAGKSREMVVSDIDFSLDSSFAGAEEVIDFVSHEATFRVKGCSLTVAPPGARWVWSEVL